MVGIIRWMFRLHHCLSQAEALKSSGRLSEGDPEDSEPIPRVSDADGANKSLGTSGDVYSREIGRILDYCERCCNKRT